MQYEVILDTGETPNKCTIAPLHDRNDFRLIRVQGNRFLGPLTSTFLLHHEGQCLTTIQADLKVSGIASIDCVWKRLNTLIHRIEGPLPLLVRIPDGFETAYPRQSKKDTDPAGGLATIEAIFVAAALLGNWDASLFSLYYFGRKFIELNAQRFLELGVHQAADTHALPKLAPRDRNSQQRRRDRGRLTNSHMHIKQSCD
jgi:pre-rRNA-processing protein TSR3